METEWKTDEERERLPQTRAFIVRQRFWRGDRLQNVLGFLGPGDPFSKCVGLRPTHFGMVPQGTRTIPHPPNLDDVIMCFEISPQRETERERERDRERERQTDTTIEILHQTLRPKLQEPLQHVFSSVAPGGSRGIPHDVRKGCAQRCLGRGKWPSHEA